MKEFLKKYSHAVAILYLPFYLFCFTGLERRNSEDYYVVESELDALIPFCEWFVIPYFLWFVHPFPNRKTAPVFRGGRSGCLVSVGRIEGGFVVCKCGKRQLTRGAALRSAGDNLTGAARFHQ